ncbi:MAG: hypothetical protein WCC60_04345 [Ilumatobacteraceae bacterium]
MNHDINKDGNSMTGNESTGRRRRKAGTMGVVGVAGLCVTAAALVPMPTTTQAIETGADQGMVCEWGDFNTDSNVRAFTLTATSGYTTEPDGNAIFDWSYTADGTFQLPGPTLCANTGDLIQVTLNNELPVNTSIQFPGQTDVTFTNSFAAGPVGPVADASGNLTSLVQDAPADTSNAISYSFPAYHEGTFVYQSGTDPQLQVQMGLFGSMVIYPSGIVIAPEDIGAIPVDGGTTNEQMGFGSSPYRADIAAEANCAYRSLDDPAKCDPLAIFEADRENILVLSEVDPGVHAFIEQEQLADHPANLNWSAYPVGYEAHYFMINGRSMPDTIAPNFAPCLPSQPYGSLATVEPWDATINPLDAFIRYVGIGTAGYDFHPHSNHEHVIATDAWLMKSATVPVSDTNSVAIPAIDTTEEKFNILVGAGSTVDATFRWTNEENYSDDQGHRTSVQWPQGPNMMEGDFWSGSPYLGDSGLLNPGIIGKTQCGEYYHVAHNHDLTQVTNYGITFGGMLTLIKVEPLGTGRDVHSPCHEG